MKIIEKKCPNCGAGLSFGDTDKSCKCDYCHREFEIERENNNAEDIYNLIDPETAKNVAKVGIGIFAASYIIPIIAFIVFAIIGVSVFWGFSSHANKQENVSVGTDGTLTTPQPADNQKVKTDINELSNTDLKRLSTEEESDITSVLGRHDTKYAYQANDIENIKYILAYKDNANYVYVVKKVLYINFFNQKDKKTVIIPVRFENVNKVNTEELDSVKVDAPKCFLNNDKSSYIRGCFANYKQFYATKIDPLKKQDFTITEK